MQLQRELDKPWRTSRGDAAEVCTRSGIPVGLQELCVIPGVEHLCPELQSRRFAWQGEEFLDPQVEIVDPRTVDDCWPAIAEVTYPGDGEATGVEPKEAIPADGIGQPVAASAANTIRKRRDIRTAGLVGPSQVYRLPGREGR